MEEIKKRGITVIKQTDTELILLTTNLLNTIFLLQSKWWRLERLEDYDIIDNGRPIEQNLLYYYKNEL